MAVWENDGSDGPSDTGLFRLSSFLREIAPSIVKEWFEVVRAQPNASKRDRPALTTHLAKVLETLCDTLLGQDLRGEERLREAVEAHLQGRLSLGLSPLEVLEGFGLLRRLLRQRLSSRASPWSAHAMFALESKLDETMLLSGRALLDANERVLIELERIFDAALELLELDSLLPLLLNVLKDVLPSMDMAVLMLWDGTLLRVRAAVGAGTEILRGSSVEIGEGLAGRIAQGKGAVHLRFAGMDPVVDRGLLRGMHSLYGVPLLYGDALEGVAYMASRTRFEFAVQDQVLFRALCGRATALIVHQRRVERERSARTEVLHAKGQLEAMLTASPFGVCFLDRELRYVRINDALAAINDKPVQEHLGWPVHQASPDLADTLMPALKEILDTGRAFTNQEICLKTPGRPHVLRWFNANCHPVRLEQGEIAGAVVVLVEISARKRAEAALRETEERLQALQALPAPQAMMDGLGDHAVFMLDAQGRIGAWSASAQRMFGYGSHEVLGQGGARLYATEDAAAGKPERLLQQAQSEGRVEVSTVRLRKDGSLFHAHCAVSVLKSESGSVKGFAVVTRDLDARSTPPSE